MNRQEFLSLIHAPKSPFENMVELQDLVDRFPYCAISQVLLSYQLFHRSDLGFSLQLRKAAAYTSSRKKLKWLIELPTKVEEISAMNAPMEVEVDIAESESPTQEVLSTSSEGQHEPTISPDIEVSPEAQEDKAQRRITLLDIVNKRLAEIEAEKERKELVEPEFTPTLPKPLSKTDLVDKFIREEPRISRPKADFYSPSDLAVRSSTDDEEIVSETLALLFIQQGNKEKARHIYKKLSLLFPEKSSYFAAQIENLS